MSPSLHIVHTEASQGWGGQEIRILTEAGGMLARGHRVTLLAPAAARIHAAARERGIPVVAMPLERKDLASVRAMRRWLRENPADVVNTHSSIDSWVVGLARLFGGPRVAVVRTRHISAPVNRNLATRWLYLRSAGRVVTTGESLRRDLIARLGAPEGHVLSVPTGIDLERFDPAATRPRAELRAELGIPAAARVVGIAATLRSWKGHDYLLEAFPALAAEFPDLHLLIAGDGPRRERIAATVHASGLAGRIHLAGHRDDVPDLLAAMDLFALPSYANEGVPQAILQAMAMGLPVVSTPIGAIEEAVMAESTGLLVPPRDAAALGAALARLLREPESAAAMGAAGRERVHARFTLAGMVERMEGVFREVCGH